MWNLPRAAIEPMFSSLAGGFLIPGLPGEKRRGLFYTRNLGQRWLEISINSSPTPHKNKLMKEVDIKSARICPSPYTPAFVGGIVWRLGFSQSNDLYFHFGGIRVICFLVWFQRVAEEEYAENGFGTKPPQERVRLADLWSSPGVAFCPHTKNLLLIKDLGNTAG